MTVWQSAIQRITSISIADGFSRSVSNLLSTKLTFGSYAVSGLTPVPYAVLPAENFLNYMMLQVRVPVLSEKMYSTWPSSSFKLLACAFANTDYSSSHISMSRPIKVACASLQISSCTMSEMGTIFVNIMTQVMEPRMSVVKKPSAF